MKKPSLSFELEGYLRQRQGFVHSVELEDFARTLGFKASNSSRRLREMYDKGMLERDYRLHEGVRVVWYRFKETIDSIVLEDMRRSLSPESKQISMKL